MSCTVAGTVSNASGKPGMLGTKMLSASGPVMVAATRSQTGGGFAVVVTPRRPR